MINQEEYEDKVDVGYALKEFAESLREFNEKKSTESEEEMKKDKEWLKEELVQSYLKESEIYLDGKEFQKARYFEISEKKLFNLIDQLDEPEVLSQELPVIPKYVADYIQEGKELGCDLGTAMTVQTEMLKGIRDYIKNNEKTFARAWLDGFMVEEQMYYIPLGVVRSDGNEFYLAKTSLDVIGIDSSSERYVKDKWNAHYYRFTEQEIKDYDERFWPFAVPVEDEEDER